MATEELDVAPLSFNDGSSENVAGTEVYKCSGNKKHSKICV
jgi:hypothetical protein